MQTAGVINGAVALPRTPLIGRASELQTALELLDRGEVGFRRCPVFMNAAQNNQ